MSSDQSKAALVDSFLQTLEDARPAARELVAVRDKVRLDKHFQAARFGNGPAAAGKHTQSTRKRPRFPDLTEQRVNAVLDFDEAVEKVEASLADLQRNGVVPGWLAKSPKWHESVPPHMRAKLSQASTTVARLLHRDITTAGEASPPTVKVFAHHPAVRRAIVATLLHTDALAETRGTLHTQGKIHVTADDSPVRRYVDEARQILWDGFKLETEEATWTAAQAEGGTLAALSVDQNTALADLNNTIPGASTSAGSSARETLAL